MSFFVDFISWGYYENNAGGFPSLDLDLETEGVRKTFDIVWPIGENSGENNWLYE